jgi:hypothetical protein
VRLAYLELRRSVKDVVLQSAEATFEGAENLVKGTFWQADFKVNSLWPKLLALRLENDPDQELDLTPVQRAVKEAAISSGELLIALCKLADKVKLE